MRGVLLRSYGLGATTADYLALISQYESGNQNIVNYKYASNPTKFSAQGYYQITMTNWNTYAGAAGVDTSQYPTPMSAPPDAQAQVASYMLTNTPMGISNWANFNAPLNAALSSAGMQTTGAVQDSGNAPATDTTGGALVDLSGAAASTPTSSIMDQLTTQADTLGIDLTDPATGFIVAAAAIAAVLLIGRRL